MSAYIVGVLVPLVFTLFLRNSKKSKKRGVLVELGGEPGYAIRNYRFSSPVSTSWEGISTLAELFEQSCKEHGDKFLLAIRKFISRETEVGDNGRSFEKLHLGDYEWLTYGQAFEIVCNFASGLTQLGHKEGERVAIFADTRAEWFLALQGCFRRNVTVVTIYASLGEEALCHSLNETEVTTVICASKELKKLVVHTETFDMCGMLTFHLLPHQLSRVVVGRSLRLLMYRVLAKKILLMLIILFQLMLHL